MIRAAPLRGLRVGYASFTRESRVVTRVTRKTRARVHERFTSYVYLSIKITDQYKFSANTKTTCNRVTRVTTRLSRVTSRVTTSFSRNHKG